MRALALFLCLLATPALADAAGTASVIDGDTIEIHGQRIRLLGTDALPPMGNLLIAHREKRRRVRRGRVCPPCTATSLDDRPGTLRLS